MRSWPGANCNPCHLAQRMQPLSPKSVCHDQDPGVCCPFCRSPFLGCSLPVLHLVQPTARAYLDLLRARMRDACVTLISTCNLSATARRRREEKRTQQKHADVVPMHRVDDSAVIPNTKQWRLDSLYSVLRAAYRTRQFESVGLALPYECFSTVRFLTALAVLGEGRPPG